MESDCARIRAKDTRVRHVFGGRVRPKRDSEARSDSYPGCSRKPELPEKRAWSSPRRRLFSASQRPLHLPGQFRPVVGKESLSQSCLRSFVYDPEPETAGARFA